MKTDGTFEGFGGWEDIRREFFEIMDWRTGKDSGEHQELLPVEPGATTNRAGMNLLCAWYTYENYSGSAFVLYEQDGQLYEVNGGHCSCHGLEGQWSPEVTTWEALAMRPWSYEDSQDGPAYVRQLVRERGLVPA